MRATRIAWMLLAVLPVSAQPGSTHFVPKVSKITLGQTQVSVLHLAPGFVTSIRLPHDVTEIAVGDPSAFKAEHAEGEPRLVFLKPLSVRPAVSNAFLTMENGQSLNLQLVSDPDDSEHIDFFIECVDQADTASDQRHASFLIAETRALVPEREQGREETEASPTQSGAEDQSTVYSWQGNGLAVSVGPSRSQQYGIDVPFSILNRSVKTIELLPPQIVLIGKTADGKRVKNEPVAISNYKITERRLGPGKRAKGLVTFERPSFKQSSEHLELMIARADQVDRPMSLPLEFTPQGNEVKDEAH